MADFSSKQEELGCACCGDSDWGTKEIESSHESDDVIISREMNELTVQEREQVLHDIYGVAKVQEETPEFVAKCLEKMDTALSQIPKAKRKAFLDRALYYFKRSIRKDKKFKLMFLRADLYDARKAATRMVKHYEETPRSVFLFFSVDCRTSKPCFSFQSFVCFGFKL
jgi:hypothetical protein